MIIRIGKASDNDFVVNDPHVSRYHAKLIREEGGCWLLEDLGSTNGTFVNGVKMTNRRMLLDGDIITAGREKFVFHTMKAEAVSEAEEE